MTALEYTALGRDARPRTGRAVARDELELDRLLEAQGLLLLRARPAGARAARRGRVLARSELVRLVSQLATATAAGVTLVDGLAGIGRRMETETGRRVADEMVSGLESGESLSAVMERHPRSFPGVVVSSVRAGEASGELARVLGDLGRHLEWSRGLRAAAVQAAIYPTLLCGAIAALVVVLLTFVLPRIAGLYPEGRATLPFETRVVLAASDGLREHGASIAVAVAALAAGLSAYARRPAGRRRLHGLLAGLPRLGRLVLQIATSRFASSAAILQAAGCDVFTVLRIAGEGCGNAALGASIARAAEAVRRGATLTAALEKEPLVDPLLVQLVNVGERTGELDRCLARVCAHYDEEVPRTVKRVAAVLEPALLVLAGALVAFVLLAALLPLFDLYEAIG